MSKVSSSNSQGVHVPKLRFPGFEEEWVIRSIGDFSSCYAGATPSTKNREFWENGQIPWLSSGEVNKKRISFTDTFITESGYNHCSTKMVPENTVVMALAGQGKTRGTVAITEIELCTNQSLAAIVTDGTIDNNYLLYYLETQYNNLRAISSGDGTRGGLNLQIINAFKISLPSLAEQKKIASFFQILENRIEKQRRLVELLKSYKRGVIYKVFADKNNPFGLLKKEINLGELLTEYRVRDTKGLRVCSVAVNKGVIDQVEHLGRSFAAADTSKYGRVKPYDIIYTKSPTGSFPFGIVKQNRLSEDVAVSPLYGVYTPKTNIVGCLIHTYFEQYQYANNYIRPLAQKGAKNTINITNECFLKGKICFPIEKEQQAFLAGFFDNIDSLVLQSERILNTMIAQKSGLLSRLFV